MHSEEFKSIVSQHKDRLFRLAFWMLKNQEDAEDLVQEVFVKLWNIRETLEKYRSIEGLLVQMTKNMCLNKLKAKKVSGTDELLIRMPWEGSDPGENYEFKEFEHLVNEVIDQLPEQQKVVLQLRAVEGLDTKEIAKMVEETENNVRVILSRARKSLRSSFQKYLSHG